jgi:hypothetical protein
MNNCPFCGYYSIDVTTAQDMRGFDRRPRFICTGPECHEWREGDGPIPEPEPKPTILDRIKRLWA